jgi:hypothetical protein
VKVIDCKTDMGTPLITRNTRHKSSEFKRKLIRLTLAGGIAFWVTSIATSLLPIASDYRAALSNWSMQTVWFASLFAGLMISCCISYCLLRHYDRIPAKDPVLKSVTVSLCALILTTVLIDIPGSIQGHGDVLHYFFIGFMFNLARFLLLGTAIGCQYNKLLRKGSP